MGAKSGQRTKAAGRQRLWLLVFVVLTVGLFVAFWAVQGIGDPSVPDGYVATVEGVPSEIGDVSQEEFDKALKQQVVQTAAKAVPKPGTKKYEELKSAALGEILDTIWVKGEAEALGITVTDKQIEDELDKIKEQSFPTEKAYKAFLKTSEFTQEDVDKRVEVQLLSTQIQEQVTGEAPPPSESQVSDYYEAAKATQFTTKPSRDIRIITSKDKGDVEAAKKALEADSSPASWKKVAAKYSEDPSTNKKGGLQKNIGEEILPEPLKGQIFDSATGALQGPTQFQGNFTLIEVVKLNPEKEQSLNEVRSQITSTLTQQDQQEFFSEFVTGYQGKWRSRTFCAPGFVIERCSNYVGSGHPATASPGCYEADPKTPATECPAPVAQLAPALPGSTTILQPQGERLPQRARPEAVATGATGAEGAAPPAGAEAPTEAPSGE